MSNPLKTGKLDRRVTVLRRGADVDDGLTRVPGAWATLTTRWGSVQRRSGREPVAAGTRAGEASQSVWLRFDSVTRTITARDAVEIDGQRFEIVAPPIEVGRREGIELLIMAAVPEG